MGIKGENKAIFQRKIKREILESNEISPTERKAILIIFLLTLVGKSCPVLNVTLVGRQG